MRIGTWNVEYAAGADRNARRLARLRQADADVWVLTETHDELDLSATHVAISTIQRPTGRKGGRWTTIWSRFPVPQPIEVADNVRTVAAVLTTPMGNIAVFGTVLPWGTDPGPSGTARGWSEMDRVLPLQLAEWARIRERHPGVPLVIAGDFNLSLGGQSYYGTKRARTVLREGLGALGLSCASEWDCLPDAAIRHSPIDHVVVPAEWVVRTKVVCAWEGIDANGVKLSDHSGLVVEVEHWRGADSNSTG